MALTVKELRKKIAEVEKMIRGKKGKDVAVETALIKSWKTYLPGGRNHWKIAPDATKSKSTP